MKIFNPENAVIIRRGFNMICVRKLLCAMACCYLLAACSSDQSLYSGAEEQNVNVQSPEDSDNSAASADGMNDQATQNTGNPETSTDNGIPTATLQSLADNQIIDNFPIELNGTTTSDSSGITAVDVLVKNTFTLEYLQPDGTMGEPYVELRAMLDMPDVNAATWSLNIANLPPGQYNIAVRATDGASKVSEWKATDVSAASAIDALAPTVELLSRAPVQSPNDFPFEFFGVATDNLSGIAAVEVNIHNRATATDLQADGTFGAFVRLRANLNTPGENLTAWSFSVASLPPGPYYFAVRAIDGESQVSEPLLTNFTVTSSSDNVAPTTTLQSPTLNQVITDFPFEFTGVASDELSGITAVDVNIHNRNTATNLQADGTMGDFVRLPAQLANPDENVTAWSFSVANLPPGPYYIAVRAIDGESQVSEPEITNFSVASSSDSVAPTVTLETLTPDQLVADFPFEFAGIATDDLSGISSVDVNIHNSATLTNLQADGTFGEFVRLQAQLDNPGENATAWSFNVASLPPGPSYIAVRAIDGESQISELTLINFTVPSSIDNVAPTATLQSLTPDQVVTDFPIEFTGVASDNLSGISVVDINIHNRATETNLQADGTMGAFVRLRATLDNPGENATDWSFSVASLPPGPYYIAVRAIDGESQVSDPKLTNFSVPSPVDDVVPVVTVQSQALAR